MVFSKCSEVLEHGKRLENMSWRLWNRELFLNQQDDDTPLTTQSDLGSDISVPDLHQVPKLSSSVESSASSCTSSNQRGSSDKLVATKLHSSSSQLITSMKSINEADGIQPTLSRRRFRPISSERVRELLKLFSPDAPEESWNFVGAKPFPVEKPLKSSPLVEKHSDSTSSSLHSSQESTTPQYSNTPVASTQPAASSSSSNVARKHSSLFQNPPRTYTSQQQSRMESCSIKSSALKRNSLSSLQNSSQQAPDLVRTGSSNAPPLFKKQSPKLGANKHGSLQKLTAPPGVPSKLSLTHSTAKSTTSLGPATLNGIQRNTSSLFSVKESAKPSLFSRSSMPSKKNSLKSNHASPSLAPKESSDDFSCSDDSDDSESGSYFEGIDSNGSRLTFKHRASTSTSIVRGFSPSVVSVSTIPKSSRSSVQLSPPTKPSKTPSMFEMTKARPDKVPREKMFFIESSSPSESETGTNSVSSQGGLPDSVKSTTESMTKVITAERHSSLFSPQVALAPKAPAPVSPEHRTATEHHLQAVSEHDDTEADDDDDDDEDDDDDDDEDDDDDYDDDSAWDSVDDESDSESFDEKAFARDDNKPKPLVRSSLLSSLFLNNPEKLMEEQQVHKGNDSPASDRVAQSPQSSAESKSISPEKALASLGKPAVTAARSTSAFAMTAANRSQTSFTLSPRTTRRNMLASELSESVRRDLLWERKQMSILSPMRTGSTVKPEVPEEPAAENPVQRGASKASSAAKLVRRHTSSDVAALSRPLTMPGESWKQDLDEDSKGDFNYHARGW